MSPLGLLLEVVVLKSICLGTAVCPGAVSHSLIALQSCLLLGTQGTFTKALCKCG